MKNLTLIRHAKSDWSSGVNSDFDRLLNVRGKKAAPTMGRRMVETRILPDLLVCSPAKRAKQTAELLAEELDYNQTDIIYEPDIYEASVNTLINLVTGFPAHEHIAIIGHNPGLSDLAEWLCLEVSDWLPTCAILSLELAITDWEEINKNCASLLRYDYPKKLSDS
jgi:phosphohistidine phosphatase